ncbi:hypothetical protein AAC387_Pa03g4306 [Persea americana]
MAGGITIQVPLVLLFLLPLLMSCCFFFTVEARPLNLVSQGNLVGDVGGFVSGLALGGIKNSGAAPGGDGHKFTKVSPLGGIKDGPSPGGGGHKLTDAHSLGGIKDGPSPGGGGHKLTDAHPLGGIKDGPSPGGGGH